MLGGGGVKEDRIMVEAKSIPGTNFRVKRFPWGLETGLECKLLPGNCRGVSVGGQETCWPGLGKWTCPPHPGLPQEALMNEHSGLGTRRREYNRGVLDRGFFTPLDLIRP